MGIFLKLPKFIYVTPLHVGIKFDPFIYTSEYTPATLVVTERLFITGVKLGKNPLYFNPLKTVVFGCVPFEF
jgi:hypothetical protein